MDREISSKSGKEAAESLKDSKGNISEEKNTKLLKPPMRDQGHESHSHGQHPPIDLLFVSSLPNTPITPITAKESHHSKE